VRAKIVDFNDWLGDSQITPILEFPRKDGAPIRLRTRYGSGAYAKMKGKEIDAIYEEGASFALISTWSGKWGAALVIFIFYIISLFCTIEFAASYFE
jgi:hypothetical protein